jgi:hypothetical protein
MTTFHRRPASFNLTACAVIVLCAVVIGAAFFSPNDRSTSDGEPAAEGARGRDTIAGAAGAVATREGNALEPLSEPRRYLWRLETEHLAALEPHGHAVESDSVTDAGHGITITSPIVRIPEDMWVARMRIRVHNAPRAILHHSALWRLDEQHPVCDFSPPMRQIALSASDIEENLEFPAPYGIFLKKGTPVVLQTMVHNPLPPIGPGGLYRDVYGEIIFEVERPMETDRSHELEFHDLVLEDARCSDSTFRVPPYAEHFTRESSVRGAQDRSRYTLPHAGTLVALGTHTHSWEGGDMTTIFHNDNPIIAARPVRSGVEPWSWVSPRHFPFLHLEAGDTLSLSAVYDNTSPSPVRGAMGMAGVYIAPDKL